MGTPPTAFEPAIPSLPGRSLDELRRLAGELVTESAFVGRKETVEMRKQRRKENARASNAIEHVDDAEAWAAHIEVESLLDRRIQEARASGQAFDPMAPEFFCWLHGELYSRMPEKFRRLEDGSSLPLEIIPGEIRERMVAVGSHWCPEPAALPGLLEYFHNRYRLDRFTTTEDRLIAVVASHSRFEFCHPFLDGNGRVGRLALHAALSWVLPNGCWWPVSAGLERDRDGYIAAIAHSHWPPAHDMDGRGPLSERELINWCRFVLEDAIHEIQRCRESNLDIGIVSALTRIDRELDIPNMDQHILVRLVLNNGGHLPDLKELRERLDLAHDAAPEFDRVLGRIEAIARDSLGFRS